MNDALPVAAAPQARDHAPPERGQEPAPSDAFAAALGAAQPAEAPPPAADPTARTAPAEGTKAEGDSSGPDTRKTADADASAVVTVPMVLPQAAAPAAAAPVPAETASAAVSAVPAGAAPVAAASAAAAAQTSGTAAATTQVTTPAVAPVKAAPADAAPQPAAATPAGPQAAARTDAEAKAATATAAQTALPATGSQRPAKDRAERAGHAPDRKGEAVPGRAPAAPATDAHDVPDAGHGPAQDRPAGDRPGEAPAQAHAAAPPDAQAPVPPRADGAARIADRPADVPQQAAAPRVRVGDVPDVARATLHVAVRQNGSAMARISLHPADLGGVRITMRVHDGAVSATLAAETPAAAQALTQTVSDLRRSLESQGLQIASLDVHVAGDGPASNGERRQSSDLARAMSTTDRAASDDAVDITTELHLVPLGTQVDVLA